MYTYAVVCFLDYDTEECFRRVWKNLSENNITQYGVESKGKRPHITIADYVDLDKDIFVDWLDKFYEDKVKVDISLSILGTFIRTGTLFLATTISTELLDFHNRHHTYFKSFNDNKKSFYLPGKWNPHCSIASRLSEDNMIQAFKYCIKNVNNIYGKLSEIALIQITLNDVGIAIEDTVLFLKELK